MAINHAWSVGGVWISLFLFQRTARARLGSAGRGDTGGWTQEVGGGGEAKAEGTCPHLQFKAQVSRGRPLLCRGESLKKPFQSQTVDYKTPLVIWANCGPSPGPSVCFALLWFGLVKLLFLFSSHKRRKGWTKIYFQIFSTANFKFCLRNFNTTKCDSF